ncbi:MAG: hypothetical protein AB1476_04860 [Candidatus Hadarchaeota archaeon]
MSLDFEKLKNIEALSEEKPWGEIERVQHELISEFLNHVDAAMGPLSQILADPSSSYSVLELILRMIWMSRDERFIPPLIQFLVKNDEDDLCEEASSILFDFGDPATTPVIRALEEDFGKEAYNRWLVEALNGRGAREFIEKILNDFSANQDRYERWFDLAHFVWLLVSTGEKESSLRMVERLLGLKNLTRPSKLGLKDLHKFITDKDGYQREMRERDMKQHELWATFMLRGLLDSSPAELVPDGPRPIIDDSHRGEYLPLLFSIEQLIFTEYEENQSLRDGDVMELLKNVRDGIWKDYEGKNELERRFITGLKLEIFRLSGLRYTKGEVSACISHVLNSVKRHREQGHGRDYLEFLRDFFKGGERFRQERSPDYLMIPHKEGQQ